MLARVRHPHIADIVSHSVIEDFGFHLICMPFLGGATLAAVLAERQSHAPGTAGIDFLRDLDAVAAPEFPTCGPVRPTREILAALTYDQAIAWTGARLADALEYAFSKEVTHGDIKPSNILLGADGSPMLLDFNLACDGSSGGSNEQIGDPGGTLAYMSPERLRALTVGESHPDPLTASDAIGSGIAHGPAAQPVPNRSDTSKHLGAHQADIYSLGLVLLEAISARAPGEHEPVLASNTSIDSISLGTAARAFAQSQSRRSRELLDEAEGARGRPIPAAFRAILERALDPEPSRRYQRAQDFAEDLDRWRSERPLLVATAPFWRHTVPRSIKRRKRLLLVNAVAWSLVVALGCTTFLILAGQRTRAMIAQSDLDRRWTDPDAYHFRPLTSVWQEDPSRISSSFRLSDPGDPRAFEFAQHALTEFGLLGPGDWHKTGNLVYLHQAAREELELWLMEQAYRYCLALAERRDSANDWERALKLLDHLAKTDPLPVFDTLSASLAAKLNRHNSREARSKASQIGSIPKSGKTSDSVPIWLSEYLFGVAAELEPEICQADTDASAEDSRGAASVSLQPTVRGQRNAACALSHYEKLLAIRPESYWGNYRAAGVCYVLGDFARTAQHLDRCLAIQPGNAVIRGQRGACLGWLGRYCEALEDCDQALDQNSDLPELYRTRAFVRAASGFTTGLAGDLQRFELLSRTLPPRLLGCTRITEPTAPELSTVDAPDRFDNLSNGFRVHLPLTMNQALSTPEPRVLAVDPGELSVRLDLAAKIRDAGDRELAASEYAKVLLLDPDDIPARTGRALVAIQDKRFGPAERDLRVVLDQPRFLEYIRRNPLFLRFLLRASRQLSSAGQVREGQILSRRLVDISNAVHELRGESHFNLARLCYLRTTRSPICFAGREGTVVGSQRQSCLPRSLRT